MRACDFLSKPHSLPLHILCLSPPAEKGERSLLLKALLARQVKLAGDSQKELDGARKGVFVQFPSPSTAKIWPVIHSVPRWNKELTT